MAEIPGRKVEQSVTASTLEGLVTIVHNGPVAVVALNRPEKRNAQTPEMLTLLADAVRGLPGSTRAMVLAGQGAVFCAGFDMKLVHDDAGALPALLRALSAAVRTLRRLQIPVVAAAHGAAVAGGCALLAGADIVVSDRASKIGYPVLKLGISPAINGPALRAAVGDGPARERTLDPELISGEEAHRTGFVQYCVDQPEDVIPKAIRIAEHLAAKPPTALAGIKEFLLKQDGLDLDLPFERGLAASLGLAGSIEQKERVAALWSKPVRPVSL